MARVRPGMTALSDHKTIGKLYLTISVVFLVVGGALALLMRSTTSGAGSYRQLFTLHGTIMVFLFLLPAWLGLASAVAPLQVGARRVAFPRAHAFCFWLFAGGAAMVVAAPLVSDVVSGWTLTSPLPVGRGFRGDGPDLLILGLMLVSVAAVGTAINLVATLLQLRAPEMALRRMPLFAWSTLVSSAVLMLAVPVLVGGLLMLFIDRHYGGRIFSTEGGDPLAWPRLFWFGAYPMLWALVIPALGAMCEIVAVFARRTLSSPPRAAAALGAIGVLSFAGWGSEVTSLRSAHLLFGLGALVVLAPVASLVLNLLLTLRSAKGAEDPGATPAGAQSRPALGTVPALAALGGLTVVAVGLAGGAVSALDAGGRTHLNTWSVATQHLLFFGFSTLGVVAATHYWAPKLWGRHLNDAVGRLSVAAVVGGLHLAFLPLFVLGINDVRAHQQGGGLAALEGVSTLGSYVLGLGSVLFAANLLTSAVAGWGRRAGADPWGGHTLEWATSSPPPPHNFDELPPLDSATPLLDMSPLPELESASS